nr:hypothetical protein [Rhizobium tropici]
MQPRSGREGVAYVKIWPTGTYETCVRAAGHEAQAQKEDACLLLAEQAHQLAPQIGKGGRALHDDARAIQLDRSVIRIEDQAGEKLPDGRIAASIQHLRRFDQSLHQDLFRAASGPAILHGWPFDDFIKQFHYFSKQSPWWGRKPGAGSLKNMVLFQSVGVCPQNFF